jgi:hypothetical protein
LAASVGTLPAVAITANLSANQIGHQRRSRKRPKLAKATRTPWPILTVVVIMAED